MPLIECIPGPAETPVAGVMYSFQKDEYGRFVASVQRFEHVACLLATPHYRQVPDVPEEAQDKTFQGFVETIKETTLEKATDAPAMPENHVETVTAVIEDSSNNAAPLMDPIAVASDTTEAKEPEPTLAVPNLLINAAPDEPKAVADAPAKKKGGRPSKVSLVN